MGDTGQKESFYSLVKDIFWDHLLGVRSKEHACRPSSNLVLRAALGDVLFQFNSTIALGCAWKNTSNNGYWTDNKVSSGRSIVGNLLDLDTSCIETALQHPDGACILFDFKAAFPSVSQEYIRRVLADIGLPACALTLIDSLYDRSNCKLSFQGSHCSGFEMGAGVRQG